MSSPTHAKYSSYVLSFFSVRGNSNVVSIERLLSNHVLSL
jgi:hypothetical protein